MITASRLKWSAISFFSLGLFLGIVSNNSPHFFQMAILWTTIVSTLFSTYKLIVLNNKEFEEFQKSKGLEILKESENW